MLLLDRNEPELEQQWNLYILNTFNVPHTALMLIVNSFIVQLIRGNECSRENVREVLFVQIGVIMKQNNILKFI